MIASQTFIRCSIVDIKASIIPSLNQYQSLGFQSWFSLSRYRYKLLNFLVIDKILIEVLKYDMMS